MESKNEKIKSILAEYMNIEYAVEKYINNKKNEASSDDGEYYEDDVLFLSPNANIENKNNE